MADKCDCKRAYTKRYVGSTDTYQFCPDCFRLSGGEETPEKRALINDAAYAEVTEADEGDVGTGFTDWRHLA